MADSRFRMHQPNTSKFSADNTLDFSADNCSYDDYINCKTSKYNNLLSRHVSESYIFYFCC